MDLNRPFSHIPSTRYRKNVTEEAGWIIYGTGHEVNFSMEDFQRLAEAAVRQLGGTSPSLEVFCIPETSIDIFGYFPYTPEEYREKVREQITFADEEIAGLQQKIASGTSPEAEILPEILATTTNLRAQLVTLAGD